MEVPQRRPNRLPNFDYGQRGYYFITVCAKDKKKLFGSILTAPEPKMILSPYGKIVDDTLNQMQMHAVNTVVEKYCIMPNHIHLLLHSTAETETKQPANAPIPQFVGTLKRFVNRLAGENLWQRSYHDHVIRNEQDYQKIWS